MTKTISATEAVRRFSDLLDTIRFRGDRYTILRGGKPVATLAPVVTAPHEKTLAELREILKRIPSLGKDAAAFERDLRKLAARQPHLPANRPWEWPSITSLLIGFDGQMGLRADSDHRDRLRNNVALVPRLSTCCPTGVAIERGV